LKDGPYVRNVRSWHMAELWISGSSVASRTKSRLIRFPQPHLAAQLEAHTTRSDAKWLAMPG
jgi:hypothetical protein